MRLRLLARTLAVAGLAAAAVWMVAAPVAAVDADLRGVYARALAGESRTQRAVFVAAGATAPAPAALRAGLAAGGPRLVLDAEGLTGGCALWTAVGGAPRCLDGSPVPEDMSDAVDPLVGPPLRRAGGLAGALAALGVAPRGEPLPVRFVVHLPTVSAARVAAGQIPAGTFAGRVVSVGRGDAAAAVVPTPLGAMSPAQVEAHALLGVLDGRVWAPMPGWLRALVLAVWTLAVARAVQARRAAGALAVAAAAGGLALLADAALTVGEVALIGGGTASALALLAGAAQIGWLAAESRQRRARPAPDGAAVATASGLHKVSGA